MHPERRRRGRERRSVPPDEQLIGTLERIAYDLEAVRVAVYAVALLLAGVIVSNLVGPL